MRKYMTFDNIYGMSWITGLLIIACVNGLEWWRAVLAELFCLLLILIPEPPEDN